MSSKRIKEIVKSAELAKGTNADPGQLGQYSATNQVNEGDLNQYLSSRGINPKFVSRETKISHAKSATFQKWKADHKNEEVESEEPLVEDAILDKYLSSRGINPKYVTKNMKVAHAKSGEFIKWKNDHMFEEIVTEETDTKDMVCFDIPLLIRVLEFTREDMKTDIELHNMVERLINMRDNVPLDMTHYDSITQKLVKENHIAIAMGNMLDDEGSMVLSQLEQLERAIAMIRSYVGKDYKKQLPAWVQAKITISTDYADTVGTYLSSKNEKVNEESKPTALEKFRKASDERQKKHDEIQKNQSKDGSGMTSAIDRLQKHMNKEEAELDEMINEVLSKDASAGDWIHDFIHSDNPKFAGKSKAERKKMALGAYYGKQNEEVEQIDELKKTTVFSWLKKQPVVPEKKPGMSRKDHNQKIKTHNKSWNRALDRLSGYKPTSEDVFQDPQAATQTSFDNGTSTNDKQEGMSKSARMIKALYKKHNMKEDTYDWEKDDKNQTSPGKKTKEVKEKPDARAILTGGKTLTGDTRDTLEIDPMMKNRPDLNGTVKDDVNSKKNNKINN
jgi:ribosomal protein L31E